MTELTTDIVVSDNIEKVTGFTVAGVHAGLKKGGALDFAIVASEQPCIAAGVFTRNTVKAAPVLVNMQRVAEHGSEICAIAINTKSANACTGEEGMVNAEKMASLVADKIGATPQQVMVMSTGVIGTQLPMAKIENGVNLASHSLGDDWQTTARAIMTTDTRPKLASVTVSTSQGQYTIAGIAKGSGMIAPNMATMLGIVVTDAQLTQPFATQALRTGADTSFNRVTVDGDTSTNDMVVLLANGASGVTIDTDSTELSEQFQEALNQVMISLAKKVVRDGEGVSKFISLHINHAASEEDALEIGRTIANSPLVKTAFFGNDANWGRIMMAAGRSGTAFDHNSAHLYFAVGEDSTEDALCLFANGQPTDYPEEEATRIIKHADVTVILDCGTGDSSCRLWTCDLSHEYVSINSDYRS